MKRRILFVDDDKNVLDGLRRMLRGMSAQWEMFFASSGVDALELLAKTPVDAVVSDMRMPVMDGAALLNRVMQLYPETLRFVLSGHSDVEAIYRSIGATHQYLAKPCDIDVLRGTLLRSLRLRDVVRDPRVRAMVASLRTVPSLPTTYTRLMDELQSPDPSAASIGAIVSLDVSLSAKILQLVNSAFFGLAQRIRDPAHAVSMLGVETIKALVLTVGIVSQFSTNIVGFSAEALMNESLEVGRLARAIAVLEKAPRPVVDAAFMGGVLHDIGMLVLAEDNGAKMAKLIQHAHARRIGIFTAEKEIGMPPHAEVGGYLLAVWGLPDDVVESVVFHNDPAAAATKAFTPLTAVHVATSIVAGDAGIDEPVDEAYLASLGLVERLPEWRTLAAQKPVGA